MDADYAVVGDPEVDVASRHITSQTSHQASQRRSRASSSSHAGKDRLSEDDIEERPLLSRDVEELYLQPDYGSVSSNASEGDHGVERSGAKDFEGLPWWKKPSVGALYVVRHDGGANSAFCRFSGY